MALQKQPVSISFKQGLNNKADKWQLPTGQFSALTNTQFNKEGLLEKRNGYKLLTAAPDGSQTLSTLNDGLVVLGNICASYSSDTGKLTEAGMFQPMTLSTSEMARRATSQLTADVAVASNNLACASFMDSDGQSYYQILDSTTGQIVVPAVQLPAGSARPKSFVLGRYFIVTFLAPVGGAAHLQYIAIPIGNPSAPLAVTDFSTTVTDVNQPYDGVVSDGFLYIAYNSSDVGGAVRVGYLNSVLNQPSAAIISSVSATAVAVTVDATSAAVWVVYYAGTSVSAAAYTQGLVQQLAPTVITAGLTAGVPNLTASANNGVLTAIYEVYNTYGYAANIRTDYVAYNTLTIAGTAGTSTIVSRGIGLASRSAYVDYLGKIVMLVAYGQTYQPTYMLMDLGGNVLARTAYSNGGGYTLDQVLPNINVNGNILQVGYRFADQLIPVNKEQNADAVNGVYAQYGVNLVRFSLGGQTSALEIGGSLHPSGGMLWQYDGVKIREHGFNFWPEDVQGAVSPSGGGLAPQQYYYQVTYEWTDAAGNIHRSAPSVPLSVDGSDVTPIGTSTALTISFSSGATTMTLASTAGLFVGQTIIDVSKPDALAANTKITNINTGTGVVTFTPAATANSSGSTDTIRTDSLAANASFVKGSKTLQMSSVDGFRVGQILTDLTTGGNLNAGTTVSKIDTTNKILSISQATTGSSAQDIIQTTPITFTATGPANAQTLVVNSIAGLYVGMYVTDSTTPGNIPPDTYIIEVDPILTRIAISKKTTASFVNDTFSTQQITFGASFNTSTTTATVTSTSGLYPGLELTDITTGGNLAGGTTISSVDSVNNSIVLSTLPTGATAQEVIATDNLLAQTLYIPTLRQTYKTDNKVRIVIYRWSIANQVYYQITNTSSLSGDNPMVLNDPSVDYIAYNDILPDAAIIGNNIIYTTGGVVENICTPGAVSMALWQNRLWTIDAEDQNLLRYSKVVIENTPVEMSDLFTLYVAPTTGTQGSTGPSTAISAMDDKLIVFKRDAIYYITGQGPDNTGAGGTFSDPVYITSSVGCINPFSTVLTPVGIMFQSDKGIWLLSRDLSTTYIGANVEDYATGLVTSALTVPGTNQVRFTLDNKITVMYDYYFQLWGNWSNIAALSSTINEELHTFLDDYGRIVQETPGTFLDIDVPVLWNFTTGWFNLAGLQGFERFYSMNLLGQYKTPHKLFVEISYDYNPGISQTIEITPDNYTGPYGSDPIYGDNTYGGESYVEKWRVFPERQKCSSFKITIREIFDPSYSTVAGAGLTLSGLLLLVGIKRGSRTQSAATSAG